MKNQINEYKDWDLWVLLSRTYHIMANSRDAEFRKYGISRHQAFILYIIKTLGDYVTPTEIANVSFREKNSITDILNRMVKKGLVTKTKDPDLKSRIRISLTEKGQQTCKKYRLKDPVGRVMSILSEEERRQFQLCLEKLLDNTMKEISYNSHAIIPPSQLASSMPNENNPKNHK